MNCCVSLRCWLLCFGVVFGSSLTRAAVTFTDLIPRAAAGGSTIELDGSGFEADARVLLNGVDMQIVSRAPDRLVFRTLASSGSGAFTVAQGGQNYTNWTQFRTVKMLPGKLDLPAGLSITGYALLMGFAEPPMQPDGTFQAPAPVDMVTTIWAVREEADPAFIAVVTPEMTQVQINARTTAEALILTSPGVWRRDPATIAALRSKLGQIPETQMLADVIATIVQGGRDYLDDARVKDLWTRAGLALIAPTPTKFARRAHDDTPLPRGTWQKYINPPDGAGGYPDLHRLKGTLSEPDPKSPDAYKLKMESADLWPLPNPVDWIVEIYELDPLQFPDGFNSINALNYKSTPLKKRADPDDTAVLGASLKSKYIDLLDLGIGYCTDFIFSHTVDNAFATGPDEVALPARGPGIYVTETYSGNVFWGTSIFSDVPRYQTDLIDQLHRRPAYAGALVDNIVAVSIDTAGLFVPLDELIKDPGNLQEIIYSVSQDVTKAVAIHGDHPLQVETVYDLIKTSTGSFAKNALAKLAEKGPGIKTYLPRVAKGLKMAAKALDFLSKVSAGAQAVERTTGLLCNTVLAVERNVVVVGDPFAPEITAFDPTSGRGGEMMIIQGKNFSANTNDLHVFLASFGTTTGSNEITKSLEMPVLYSTPTGILTKIPTNGIASFPDGLAYIVVSNKQSVATTIPLKPPYQQFHVIPPPAPSSVTPSPAIVGGIVQVLGANFAGQGRERIKVIFDDGGLTAFPTSISSNAMLINLPLSLQVGQHRLKVQWDGTISSNINFELVAHRSSSAGTQGQGLDISITKADMSNVADGQVSVLEAVLIANGTLGRPIEDHLPCEFLPAEDPSSCPFQQREIDNVLYYADAGPGAGALTADRIRVRSALHGKVMSGALPPLRDGDAYYFESIVIDGGGAAQPGLLFDGTSQAFVNGLILKNFGGNGIEFKNGASHNRLEDVRIENAGGSGMLISDGQFNSVTGLSVSNAVTHGIYLTGPNTTGNSIQARGGNTDLFTGQIIPYSRIERAAGNGFRIDNGAHHNNIFPGTVRENGAEGILITGPESDYNYIGRIGDNSLRLFDVVKNGSHGVHITAGVNGTVFRYIAAAGNQGDGFLFEGTDCAENQIDRPFIGLNYYEGGTDVTLPNQGSGIHLKDGAHHNLIGTHTVNLGETGTICANRDDGILLEGGDTAFNTINQQWLGLATLQFNPLLVRFAGNEKAGIRLRLGAHDNRIGDSLADLANIFFDGREAALVIENSGTTDNLVFGNQFGADHNLFATTTGLNRVAIWIRDGANANTIGLPYPKFSTPSIAGFKPTIFQFWNVIVRSAETGILIENSSGQVGTDGILTRPNVLQNNKIGEEDNGNLAANLVGLKLGSGAYANVIGGPAPANGNIIRGQNKYGIWIQNNDVPSPLVRNRFQNNLIGETAGPLRYNDYTNTTPASGIGLFVQNSSGHVFGETRRTQNTFNFNRIGAYFENSSSNVFQGNLVTNQFIAGVVVRGGEENRIGSSLPQAANEITASGLNEAGPQAGVALSFTKENKVMGNLIGHIAPGRGGIGLLINNAQDNQIGGGGARDGNIIVSNIASGIVVTGPTSSGNGFFNNYVGVDRNRAAVPNGGDGIALSNDAHDNRIGGFVNAAGPFGPMRITAKNYIANNQGAGVSVTGANTVGNSIIYNQITANGGKGIQHLFGGNNLIPPPTMLTFDGKNITGTVPDLTKVPPGSRIQLFTDPDTVNPEGDAFIGEAFVQADGSWKAALFGRPFFPVISMTSTHAVDQSTSEFGTGTPIPFGFRVARTDGVPTESVAAGATQASVFKLSLTALNMDVRVKSLAIDAGGSLPDATAIAGARLVHDIDRDGSVSPGDEMIAGPLQFTADNGRITFAISNQVVEASSTEQWLLAFDLNNSAPNGSQFTLSVTNADSVDAELLYPPLAKVTPAGNFSIDSAQFTVSAGPSGMTLATWKSRVFTASQLADPNISGNNADPDGDGVINLLEYAFNLNPLVSDRSTATQTAGIPQAARIVVGDQEFLTITFVRRGAPVDLKYTAQVSEDLLVWTEILDNTTLATTTVMSSTVDGAILEHVVVQLARPIRGANQIPVQYVRVRVEQTP